MMKLNKNEIIDKICYTELVYGRVNKKLGANYTKNQIEEYIRKILINTVETNYSKNGKNYYISNREYKIRITINSNTFRVITVDKLN